MAAKFHRLYVLHASLQAWRSFQAASQDARQQAAEELRQQLIQQAAAQQALQAEATQLQVRAWSCAAAVCCMRVPAGQQALTSARHHQRLCQALQPPASSTDMAM